jgi:hypothetical protein
VTIAEVLEDWRGQADDLDEEGQRYLATQIRRLISDIEKADV